MIAENDAETRNRLRFLFEREGFTCEEAATGPQAVEMARRHPPRCLLLDVVMPEMDAVAVARQLRSDPRTRGIHIDFLAAAGEVSTCRDAGAEVILTKPIDVPALLKLVRRQVEHKQPKEARGLTKTEAEDLLDWFETNGFAGAQLFLDENGMFGVRCAQA
jgi:two-component system response regulator ResD